MFSTVSVAKDHIAVANLLVKNGCNVNLADRSSEAPIHVLVRQSESCHLLYELIRQSEYLFSYYCFILELVVLILQAAI